MKRSVPYCYLRTHEGRVGISESEADAIVANRGQYDMFVDAVHVHARGKYSVSKRNEKGELETTLVSRTKVLAVVELAELGVPTIPSNLAAFREQNVEDPVRMLQRARESVDVRDGDGWRAIHAVAGDRPGHQRYVWRVPPRVTFAMLIAGRL